MMWNPMFRSAFVVAAVVFGLAACKADESGGGGNQVGCITGSMVSCNCATAPALMTSCRADGTGYNPCTCPAAGAAGMGAGGSVAQVGTGGTLAPGSGGMGALPGGTGGAGPITPPAGTGGAHAGTGGVIGMMAGTGGVASGTGGTMGGTGGAMAGSGGTASTDDAMTSMLRDACVAEINMYRATLTDAPPLVRASAAQEMCSDMGAQVDGDAMVAHGFFKMASSCIQTVGLSAQDTCPGWPVGGGFGGYATMVDALKGCLKQMWAEGNPSQGRDACQMDVQGCFQMHGHYLNMSNPKATAASCAFYKMKDGMSWWMNQDFVVKWF